MQRLLDSKNKFTNNLGFVCQGVRCPICRQYTDASDVYFIDNNENNNKEEEISLKVSYVDSFLFLKLHSVKFH